MSVPGLSDTAPSPLDGCLVVDLSSGIAGAYCTRLPADGGAAVVKVEPPGGDALRCWTASGAPLGDGRDAPLFSYLAGGKQSVIFSYQNDMWKAAGAYGVEQSWGCADVFV